MSAAKRTGTALEKEDILEDILYDELDLNETMAIMNDFRAWLKQARAKNAIAAARRKFYDNMIEEAN